VSDLGISQKRFKSVEFWTKNETRELHLPTRYKALNPSFGNNRNW